MDNEVPIQVSDSDRIPKFLTTVTPFPKTLALIMFITLPILGFYLGHISKVSTPENTVNVKVPTSIPTPTTEPSRFKCTDYLCIENGTVYYTDKTGNKVTIAESTVNEETPVNYRKYRYANLSPKGNFIHLSGTGWEYIFDEIYDIKTGKIYGSETSGELIWLNDERLLIIGGCGMGYMECGQIYLSVDGKTPWKQKLFAETPLN